MVRVTEELALSAEHVLLYHTTDPLLGHLPVLIFHGPSTTANYTFNSSRVQVHIYSPAGFQSFPRLTISPNSDFYDAVGHLPREYQGDEVYRAMAFGLCKYFRELPDAVKNHIRLQYPAPRARRPGLSSALFSDEHAADIVKAMVKSENTAEVIQKLHKALQTQHISNIDVDLLLPPGAIVPLQASELEHVPEDEDDLLDPSLRQYGAYTPLVRGFGEPIFIPTSRLRRAPSKPSALNRTKAFTKDQKIELRRKLAELVDTEERYVHKVTELVKHIADEYRKKAAARSQDSFSPTEEDVDKLFPRSADHILQVNSVFMQELRRVMDSTEEEALKDIESSSQSTRPTSSYGKAKDPTGALPVAKVMLEWFPKFADCYQDYIRASQHFPQLITSFVDQQSSFSQRVANTGEQHLRSTIIEPVQRLPRYSLIIDQLVSCLPITHPALQSMLKARDIIANICSMDDPSADKPIISNRLRNMIDGWPSDLEPRGRLITAVDFSEMVAPFEADAPPNLNTDDRTGIFLLFSDCVVIVKKMPGAPIMSRDLLREIDKPSAAGLLASMTNAAGGSATYELAFEGWHELANVRFTESMDGRMTWMAWTLPSSMQGTDAGEFVSGQALTTRVFVLLESYEGKASKWSEDIVKARIESRFSEAEREDGCWSLRSVRMPDSNLGLFAAVYQEGISQLVEGRKEPAPIRIVIDHDKGTKGCPVGHYGVEIVSEVMSRDMRKVTVITAGISGKKTMDEVFVEDLLPTLARRIIQLLSLQFNNSNVALAPALVSFNTKILRCLNFSTVRVERTRSFLTSSPVKMLASLLGGGNSSESLSSAKPTRTPVLSLFPTTSFSRSNTSLKETASLYGSATSRDGLRPAIEETKPENPLVRLEQTFTGYMASLLARKGDFVGHTLLNRGSIDELAVNDLYNKLIESPFDIDSSADVGADVVFAAFEKFVRIAWREQMGPIITPKALDALQDRLSRRAPGGFGDFVRFLFSDIAPQNQRAFTSLIKLLADLLDGCANDSDRGALTLSFAQLLVDSNSAFNYINLLDRLVEDCDRIFPTVTPDYTATIANGGSTAESLTSANRSAKSHTGSLTSNTSSLRKKFGFDSFSRQGSKNDGESRQSVWRSLSKHGRVPATVEKGGSVGRPMASRSKSGDMITGSNRLVKRPVGRDRPPVAGAFDDSMARPTSSHRLATIGEPDAEDSPVAKAHRRAKRRSSLSDLKSLMEATTLRDKEEDEVEGEEGNESLKPLSLAKPTSGKFNSIPRLPPPSRIPISPPVRTQSSRQKENLNMDDAVQGTAVQSTPPLSSRKRHGKGLSMSAIPTPKVGRGPTATTPPRPSTSHTSPSKPSTRLRLQSPQKLRERLTIEKKWVDEVDANLQSELSKISTDMSRVSSTKPRTASAETRRLSSSVAALESRLPTLMKELRDGQDALRKEIDCTLQGTELKLQTVDRCYKELQTENNVIWEKYHTELTKIAAMFKSRATGDKDKLMEKMIKAEQDSARYQKETWQLRREVASLKALLKAGRNVA